MFRRAAASLTASAALTTAGLLAAAPLAQAEPAPTAPTPPDDGGISLLNDLTVLPVQACGIDAGIPILSNVLDSTDAAPDASCAVVDDDTEN